MPDRAGRRHRVGGESVRTSQVDATAKPGIDTATGSSPSTPPGSLADNATPRPTKPDPHVNAGGSGAVLVVGSGLTSTLMRGSLSLIGLLMLLATAGATTARPPAHAHVGLHPGAREGGPRLAMTGVAPAALVIPALIVLGGCAVIVLVLLNL